MEFTPTGLVLFMLAILGVLFLLYKTGAIDGLASFAEKETRSRTEHEQGMRRWRAGHKPHGGPRL